MTAADPQPLLPGLPVDEYEVAFRAIETILRSNPTLDANVKTWRSREGFDTDLQVPVAAMMPLVGLSPVPVPVELWGVDELKANFGVSVQVFVPGTCSRDVLGLWGAIRAAVRSTTVMFEGAAGQATVRDFCCNVFGDGRGLINLRPHIPAFLPVDLTRPDGDPAFQMGIGSILCYFAIPK